MDIVRGLRLLVIHDRSGRRDGMESMGPITIRISDWRAFIVRSINVLRLRSSDENNRIWLVRLGLSAYYTYRISSIQVQSEELQKQRDAKIEKLKIATKYNSTQELLQKYSGNPTPNSTSAGTSKARVAAKSKVPSNGPRTPFVPPPTANIPDRDEPPPFPRFPQNVTSQVKNRLLQEPEFTDKMSSEIAPNAFSAPFQYAPVNEGLKWYDRLMDVLMGEDETRAAARLALICSSCRLVNGQAPPGVRCLEDLGKWRCSGCGAMNEEETEAGKIMAAIEDQSTQKTALYMNKGRKNGPAQEGEIASDPVDNEYESDVTRLLTGGPEGGKEVIQVMEEDPKPLIEPDNLQRRPARLRKGKKAG